MIELEMRDGVALLWLDTPDARVNTLNVEALGQLAQLLDRVEADGECRAIAIISRKLENFIAGVDINLFLTLTPEELDAVGREGQRLFSRIASFPKPILAAVHGACAGGGFELALACHYRLASNHPATSFALPEVRLGLLPGLGGTQRLPRLIGLEKALGLIVTGRSVYARQARRLGIVDSLHHPEGLTEASVAAAQRLAAGTLSRQPRKPGVRGWLLESTPLKQLVYRAAGAGVAKETRGNYPAPARILEVVRTGMDGGIAAGLAAETEAFGELARTPEAKALMNVFFARSATRRNPLAGQELPVASVGVLGAGLMGGGIAQVSAEAGLQVTMIDQSPEVAAGGLGRIARDVGRRVGKGLTPFERDRILGRIGLSADLADAAAADLTIEAVPEILELKRQMLARIEEEGDPEHVFATNTSSIPIGEIAAGAARPDRVVGMHYFSPVPKMPLLEVVRGDASSDEAVATAVAVGLRQGKSVIVVRDRPGFYVNRILAPYMSEALRLLQDGARIEAVDTVMRNAGFPVGPFKLLDEVGLDVAGSVTGVMAPLFEARGTPLVDAATPLLAAGLKGRKSGRGFYGYERGRGGAVNGQVYRLLGVKPGGDLSSHQIRQRMLLALVNEAAHTLGEGIIASATDGDLGAVFGMGFPPFLGGPFRYMDTQGPALVATELDALRDRHGARFEAAPILREMAADGRNFH